MKNATEATKTVVNEIEALEEIKEKVKSGEIDATYLMEEGETIDDIPDDEIIDHFEVEYDEILREKRKKYLEDKNQNEMEETEMKQTEMNENQKEETEMNEKIKSLRWDFCKFGETCQNLIRTQNNQKLLISAKPKANQNWGDFWGCKLTPELEETLKDPEKCKDYHPYTIMNCNIQYEGSWTASITKIKDSFRNLCDLADLYYVKDIIENQENKTENCKDLDKDTFFDCIKTYYSDIKYRNKNYYIIVLDKVKNTYYVNENQKIDNLPKNHVPVYYMCRPEEEYNDYFECQSEHEELKYAISRIKEDMHNNKIEWVFLVDDHGDPILVIEDIPDEIFVSHFKNDLIKYINEYDLSDLSYRNMLWNDCVSLSEDVN